MNQNTLYTVGNYGPQATTGLSAGDIWRQTAEDAGAITSFPKGSLISQDAQEAIQGGDLDAYMNERGGLFNLRKKDNPLSKGNVNVLNQKYGDAINAAGSVIGNFVGKGISDGFSSGVGNGIMAGANIVGGIVKHIDPVIGTGVQIAGNIIGGATNRVIGTKVDQAALNAANAGTHALNNYTSNAGTYDGIQDPQAVANVGNVYTGGLANKGSAKRKNNQIQQDRAQAFSWADRSKKNNSYNIGNTMVNDKLASYAAFGGPLNIEGNPGAIDYGFMQDYLTLKNNQIQSKERGISPIGFAFGGNLYAGGGNIHIKKSKKGTFTAAAKKHGMSVQKFASEVLNHPDKYSPEMRKKANFARNAARWHAYGGLLDNNNLFAIGGDLQTNGGDYSTGLTSINEGGSHEENPYDGVAMGMAPDGQPNLVEEGETIFNDYVFSNRIELDADAKKRFHINKNRHITYAEFSKKLEKEAAERPNDAVSQAALKANMEKLEEEQERQKTEEEAQEAMEAFEQLPPEQQIALMQQLEQQQGTPEQEGEAPQEEELQGQEEVPVDENGNPVDPAMMQQAQAQIPPEVLQQAAMQGNVPQEAIAQEAVPQEGGGFAYGGKIGHRFDDGGKKIKQAILNALKLKNGQRVLTQDMFNDWAKENNVIDFDYNGDWTKALQNNSFKAALTKASPELAYAIANGYGTPYDASTSSVLNTDQTKGNWVSYMPASWKDSSDAFMKELNWDTINDMSNKEFANAVRNTNAYKNTTEWLKSADNAKRYFQALLDDDNTPESAINWIRTHALDNNGNWIGGKFDYDTMLKPVREDDYVGSFWKSAVPATIPDVNKNLLVGKDGSISIIDTDDLSGLTKVGNPYKWIDANGNNTYTFYSMPETVTETSKSTKDTKTSPKHLPYIDNRFLSVAGLFGPAVGLGMQALGIGKPDTRQLNASLENISTVRPMGYRTISSYLPYNPADIWADINSNTSLVNGVNRDLSNNGLSTTSKNASIIANTNKALENQGKQYINALQYNDNLRKNVADYNRATDIQNANAFNRAEEVNANAINHNNQLRAQLAADLAGKTLAVKDEWNKGIYGNVGQIFEGLNELGTRNDDWNRIAALYNAGAIGQYALPEAYGMNGVNFYSQRRQSKGKAKGGKINRKKN